MFDSTIKQTLIIDVVSKLRCNYKVTVIFFCHYTKSKKTTTFATKRGNDPTCPKLFVYNLLSLKICFIKQIAKLQMQEVSARVDTKRCEGSCAGCT